MFGILRIGCAAAATGVLLVPAIWNGFPLLEYDTGGYLARWFEGTLVVSRSTTYALLLTIFAHPDFWPVVIIQAALTVWVLALTLRALGFENRPLLLVAVTAPLSAITTLPWLASILLTDIFAGIAVLAIYLLVLAPAALARWERRALIVLLAFAVSTHGATLPVALALVFAAAIARKRWQIGSGRGIAAGAAALGLGAAMLLAANYAVAGRLAWTPGATSLAFGRMLQDGIVARYLHDHCAERHLKLCAFRSQLPEDADSFFWSDDKSVFNRLGRFQGLDDEMSTIVFESLKAYPAWQIESAARATVRQLFSVASGEGVEDTIWHTYGIIRKFEPSVVPDMLAAQQQQGGLDFSDLNRLHVPVALGSMALLVPLIVVGLRQPRFAGLAALSATIAIALLANAFVCGVFSNPHDRYGARLAWLPPLAILLAAWRFGEERESAPARSRSAGAPASLGR